MQEKGFLRVLHGKLKDLPCFGFKGSVKLAIGLVSFFIDAWITSIQYNLKYRNKVVIYDRFFYDQFIIFGATFTKVPWWIVNISKILPRNDITIIMSVPVEVARKRKPEDSIEKLQKCSEFYRRLAPVFKSDIIDGTQDVSVIADSIFERCRNLVKQSAKSRSFKND